jgi:autotransporter-associated beta strand protein
VKLLFKPAALARLGISVLYFFSWLGLSRAAGADYYVATNGSDANPGTLAAPFLTLTQAQAVVRAALPSASGPVNVWLRGGTYYLGQTLNFGPQDSGSVTVPVTYSGYSNETVTLSGAVKLTPTWTTYSGSIMVANIGTGRDFDGLFVNGAQQVLARYPNYNANTVILNGYASDCISSNRAARWANPTTGLVRGLHGSQWGGNSFKITGKDSSGNPTLQWVGDNNRGSTLHTTYRMVENLFEELDTANEWFYNKTTGNLYFWPPSGLNLATATVEAATVTELLGFRGSATNNTVRRITFSNFTFTQTHRSLFNTAYEGLMRGDWAVAREGTIYMSNADYITIQNSTFTNLGGNGIFMSAHNRTNLVNNNSFVNIGATCVQVVGLMSSTRYPSTWSNQHTDIADTTAGPITDDYPMGCIVSSNYMHNMGVFEKESAGVNISEADSIIVSHNTIHTSPRSGINVNCGCFGGHIIEFNDVWDTVRETSDHGPFNSWGRDRYWSYPKTSDEGDGDEGTQKRPYALIDVWKPITIRNNRFQYSSVQTWGIDLDDGSSNYQIYNNVCLNTGFKLRDGFSRHVFNNIVVNQQGNLQVWYDQCQDKVDHNIIINSTPWALVSLTIANLPAKQVVIDTNFFWNGGGGITLPLSGWTNAGYDVHSLALNPAFSNVAANDYTVNNPLILASGFTNIPMNQFGTTKPGTPTAPAVTITQPSPGTPDPEPLMGALITSIYSQAVAGVTGLPDTNGVCFQNAPNGSYAAIQGFQTNDVIRQINGVTVTDKQSFWTNYTTIAPGSLVNLILWRNAIAQPFSFIKMGGPEELNETAGTIFTGTGWYAQANSSCYNGDLHATMTNGDSFQFKFYGTGIEFLSEKYTDESNVDVYIDGALDQTINCYNATRLYQQVVYNKQGLTPGIHTIQGIKDNSSYLILDALVVLQTNAPAAPGNLSAAVLSNSQIKLTWNDNATNETAYIVQRSSHGANFWTTLTSALPAGSTNYADTGLDAATIFDYRVCCVNAGGPSAYATTVTATTSALLWQGDGSANNWNLTATNWTGTGGAANFSQGNDVTFDDTGSNSPAINLTANLSPASVTVNATKNYTFSGAGQLSGSMSLAKSGVGSLTINNTNTFGGATTVSGGKLIINGSNGSSPITVGSGGLLGGNGIISGNTTVNSGGTLSPGNSPGTLTFSNALTLNSGCTNYFEISKSPTTNDVAKVLGALTCGGTLIVTNISANALASGDSFKLFNAASYSDAFAKIILPPLPAGLGWNTNSLNTSGALSVVVTATPVIGSAAIAGNGFVFIGTGGVAGGNFYLLGSTDIAAPLTNWTRLLTNQFDNNGNFNFTNLMDTNWPQSFYRLQL